MSNSSHSIFCAVDLSETDEMLASTDMSASHLASLSIRSTCMAGGASPKLCLCKAEASSSGHCVRSRAIAVTRISILQAAKAESQGSSLSLPCFTSPVVADLTIVLLNGSIAAKWRSMSVKDEQKHVC